MQETPVWPLGGEDSLEKEMATHSSILAWKIPWIEEPGHSSWGHKRVGNGLATQQQSIFFAFLVYFLLGYLEAFRSEILSSNLKKKFNQNF